jgi:hypothetical protein
MTKRKKERSHTARTPGEGAVPSPPAVPSLLDAMQDGNEYGSIVSLVPSNPDVLLELRRAIQEIQAVRGRPCVLYVANQIKNVQETAIEGADHLPFCEMVSQIAETEKKLDIFVSTPGGSPDQVHLFVEALRPRFDAVDFLIPYKSMSAGTLWALSGDRIWMDSRAFLGPLDPQVPSKDGTYVPAQALLTLFDTIQREGQDALAQKRPVPWAMIRLLDVMDQKQLGFAMTSTAYVINTAATYLERYKFKTWIQHSNGSPVTPAERHERAGWVAQQLASHDKWKAHGHAISRDVLWDELKIKIDWPETVAGLQRAMRRLWALIHYIFDKLPVVKMMVSDQYSFFRTQGNIVVQQ